MNKVWVLAPGENWIIDRFVKEWNEDNSDITVSDPVQADIIWLLADFAWNHVPIELLRRKKVITSIHHIVGEKFTSASHREFMARDEVTDVYHVYNERTQEAVKLLTTKPVKLIHYWANDKVWFRNMTKDQARSKLSLPLDKLVVGSFQRDTEGSGIANGNYLPKLEKGPDVFVKAVQGIPDVHVLLGGWRRQYVIKRLERSNIRFTYIELPDQPTVNVMYQAIDFYIVSSRCEGGPQALIECGLTETPCISTPVGIAEQVLHPSSISEDLSMTVPSVPNVEAWKLPDGYRPYRELIERM